MGSTGIREQAGRKQSNWVSISFESIASRSAKYRPDVDGLRAVAVLAVFFFHAGFGACPGGFVGVDVFYVISGYLITLILVRELQEDKFSIVSFYERRMRRIFPALFMVLLFCIAAGAVLFDPSEMIAFGKTLIATTLFVSNVYFWHSAHPLGYFDKAVSSQALLHTWSLSVEEQFYLFFPVTLYLLYRWRKGHVHVWLIALAVLSFAFNLWATQHRPVMAFYWIMPRAWELLAGALLALKILPILENRIAREFAGIVGLGMIVTAASLRIENKSFPGYIVLLPCVGAWLTMYAGEGGRCLVRSALSFRPLVFIGVISYSLYLWHWPIIVFSRHLPIQIPVNAEIPFVLISSVAMAFLSFEYIERPFRGGSSPFSRRQIFALGLAASIVALIFGFAAVRTNGLSQRYDSHTRELVESNLARMDDFNGSCFNWMAEVHSIADIHFCSLGGELPHKVMFWGDSHVGQMYPAIEHLYRNGEFHGRGVITAIGSGCLPDEHLNNANGGYHCDSFSKFTMLRAEKEDIDTVFIGFSAWMTLREHVACESSDGRCVKFLPVEQLRERFLADLSGTIRRLRQDGKKVIVCLPYPLYDKSIPELEISNAVFGRFGIWVPTRELTPMPFREQLRATAVGAGAEIFDPRLSLCRGEDCLIQVGGVSIYKDADHLASRQVGIIEGNLREVLQRDHESGELDRARR
jgi:peptidoglycan/LPS O-acetylase OafA/YrhL